jgi:hypothetical protein
VNICNDSGINKMDECVIHKLTVDRVGVKNEEIGVLNTRDVKVGVGISVSV